MGNICKEKTPIEKFYLALKADCSLTQKSLRTIGINIFHFIPQLSLPIT